MAYSGRVCISASKDLLMARVSSDATGNLPWQDWLENLARVSGSSVDTPITLAPTALKSSMASAKAWASMEQPVEKAAGKKYSTTGPFFSASPSE